MAVKTPFLVRANIQIQRTNGNILERDINLSNVIENAIAEHVAQLLSITEIQALALIAQWRITSLWIDEPVEP